jgi:predicted phage tail protein
VVESDRELYDPEKTGAAEVLIRAGQQEGDATLVDYGRKLTVFMIGAAQGEKAPLGKLMGQDLTRLHPAVALLANGNNPPLPPPSTPTAPAAPGALAAQAASSSAINLSWQDNSSNETSFRVEQLVGGGYQEVQVLAAGSTQVQIIGLAPGTAYTFRVRAANTAGYSGYSNIASAITAAAPPPSAVPGAPTSLSGWAASPTEVVLNWVDHATNETAFRIERQVNGSFQEVMTVGANIASARVSGLAAGSTYAFRVRASNAAGSSAYSNTATVVTPAPYPTAPGAPAGLAARGISASAIQLLWSDGATNETSFRIEKKVGSSYQEVLVVGANVTSAQITGLAPATSYSFRVRAANSVGYSGYSNIASANTAAGPTPTPGLAAPQITSASGLGGGMVQVNWRDNSSTEIQFVIEKLVNGSYQPAVTVGANSITARVTGLTKGTLYTFRVKAVDVFGHAAYSNGMNVTAR